MRTPHLPFHRSAAALAVIFGLFATFASAQDTPAPPSPETPQGAKPAEPPKPATDTKAGDNPKSGEAAKPAESAKSGETPKPAEASKPTAPAKPPTVVQDAPGVEKTRTAPTKQGDYTGKVVIIPVGEEDLMNPARFEFMSRTMKRATEEGAQAILFNIDTPGGLAWNTSTMMMQDLDKLGCRSVAYVNPRAMSAGALIAVATDAIYMSPVSTIGAASPINAMDLNMGDTERAKMNSGFMGIARSVAKSKGHNPDVVEAMIDKDVGLKVGDKEVSPKGRILTLTQDEATRLYDGKPLLAKGIVKSIDEVLQKEGLRNETVAAEPKGFELVAIWITQYAAVLLLIGLAAGYIEMQHPGIGIGGVIAAIAFFLFFFGHATAGSLVGYETIVIFLLGVALVIAELFLLPGFIVPGLLGVACILGAIIYTMAGWDFNVPDGGTFPVRFADYLVPLRNLGIGFIGALILILLFMRFFPTTGPFKFLVLRTEVGGQQAAIEGEGQRKVSTVAVGAMGIARSAMRPYGNVDFGEAQLEAMVMGDYLAPGVSVRVREVQGGKIVVERAEK
jgi:membrane-bound serine protease (ClpP class)